MLTRERVPRRQRGKKIVVFAQDSAFGQGNVAAVKAVPRRQGPHRHAGSSCRCRRPTSRRSPSRRSSERRPALRRVGRHDRGRDVAALDQQGVFSGRRTSSPASPSGRRGQLRRPRRRRRSSSSRTTSTRRRRTRSTTGWSRQMRKRNQVPDIFTPDGFVAAQMIVRARAEGRRRRRRQDDLRARGLEVPRPEGPPADPAGGPRDAPADVPGAARQTANGKPTPKVLEDGLAGQRPAPGQAVPVANDTGRGERVDASILATGTSGSTSAARRSSPMSRSRSARASSSGSSARTAPGRRRSSTCCRGCTGRRRDGRARRPRHHATTPPYRRTQAGLGRTFQISSVFPRLTVLENVRLAAEARLGGTMRIWRRARRRPRGGRARAAGRSTASGSARASRRSPARSSHGDKRKLELAMMLAGDPRVDAARRADGRRQRRGHPRARRAGQARCSRRRARRC